MHLSQADYWELVQGTEVLQTDLGGQDCTWKYPPDLGQGSYREVMLREGLELSVKEQTSGLQSKKTWKKLLI